MPQNFPAYKKPLQDGRRKVLPEQYKSIRAYYKDIKSTRKTAVHFNISRRLVMFIIHPERLKTLQQHNKDIKHWKKYYDIDKRREYMRKYRAKKRKLLNIPYRKLSQDPVAVYKREWRRKKKLELQF